MKKEAHLLKVIEVYNEALKDSANSPFYRWIVTQYNISDCTLRARIQGKWQFKQEVSNIM